MIQKGEQAILRQFGPGIWMADGTVVPFLSFRYPTRMAVVLLSSGGLWVWSPISLNAALKREGDALGAVRWLVSPNRLHHFFLAEWASAYPQASLYASPGLRRKRPDLTVDGDLGDTPEPEWAGDIDQIPMRGGFLTEVEFFHRASGTAMFADLLQNFAPDWCKGWQGVIARFDGICAPHPGAPRELRAINRRAARASLQGVLAWPLERVLMTHGDPVMTDGAAFVRHAFGWLLKPDRPARMTTPRPGRS